MSSMVESIGEPTSLEQFATLTDEEAVRRRFDAHNATFLAAVSVLFTAAGFVIALAYLVGSRHTPMKVGFAVLNFLVSASMLFVFGQLHLAERRKGRWQPRRIVVVIARNLGDWIVALLAIHFATYVLLGTKAEAPVAWGMAYPWILVGALLSAPRRLILHALFYVTVILVVEATPVKRPRLAAYVGGAIANMVIFSIGAFNSRRARRATIEMWSERRVQARDQLRMRNELQLAREVQLSMLPERPPAVSWLDIAASSVPANEVGGDYFDYFVVGDKIAVVCGDVAGHGLASGIVLTTLRSGFTLLRESLSEPGVVLKRLHDLVAQTTRRRMLASAAVLLLDPATRRARIASAGHPPLIHASNGTATSVELFAPPLGVRLPIRIAEKEIAFASGDCFVLHSDGIYETQNATGDSYGLERLERIVASHHRDGAQSLHDAIRRDVEEFRGSAVQDDDVTVVVVRVV